MSDSRRDAATQAAYKILKTIPGLDTAAVATVSMAIAAAVEAALEWKPEPVADPLNAALVPQGSWSCGCSSRECAVRWDVFSSGGIEVRSQRVHATCIRHGLVANADTQQCQHHSLTSARVAAMARLDALHAEQCR